MKRMTLFLMVLAVFLTGCSGISNSVFKEVLVSGPDKALNERSQIERMIRKQKEFSKVGLYKDEDILDVYISYDVDQEDLFYANSVRIDEDSVIYYRANSSHLNDKTEKKIEKVKPFENRMLSGEYGLYDDNNFYFYGSDSEIKYEITLDRENTSEDMFITIMNSLGKEAEGNFDPMYRVLQLEDIKFPLVNKEVFTLDKISVQYHQDKNENLSTISLTYKHKENDLEWKYNIGDSSIYQPPYSDKRKTQKINNGRDVAYWVGKNHSGESVYYYSWKEGEYYYSVEFADIKPTLKQVVELVNSSLSDERKFKSVEWLQNNDPGTIFGEKLYFEDVLNDDYE